VTAASGREALVRLREEPVDILLLDLMLPKLDAFEVCRVPQQEVALPPPYIIITSARTAPEDQARARALGPQTISPSRSACGTCTPGLPSASDASGMHSTPLRPEERSVHFLYNDA
jgi:CheY-like chemotaxis protein